MKYLGPGAPKVASYGVASVSGTILAVCSCTVLPLFSGIYRMGAGLGPATAFLYSGPGHQRAGDHPHRQDPRLGNRPGTRGRRGGFSLVIGALMAWIFRHDEAGKVAQGGGLAGIRMRRAPCGRPPRFSPCSWASWSSPTGERQGAPDSSPPCMRVKWQITGGARAGAGGAAAPLEQAAGRAHRARRRAHGGCRHRLSRASQLGGTGGHARARLADRRTSGRIRRVVYGKLEQCQADHAAPVRRGVCRGLPARAPGP